MRQSRGLRRMRTAGLGRLEFLFLSVTDVSKADLDRKGADQDEPFRLV